MKTESNNLITNIYRFLESRSLIISIVITIISFLIFFPAGYMTIDENDYLDGARLILEGELRQDCEATNFSQFEVNNYCVYKNYIGGSIGYIPFASTATEKLAFLLPLLSLLASIYVFHLLLKENLISGIFTYFFAFYPAFVYSSRTLFTETLLMLLVMLTYYSYTKYLQNRSVCRGILSGILMSLAVFVNYNSAIFFIVSFIVMSLVDLYRLKSIESRSIEESIYKIARKYLYVIIGTIPVAIVIFSTNYYLYQSPFISGYYFATTDFNYSFEHINDAVTGFFILLSLVYPAMNFAPIILREKIKRNIGFYLGLVSMIFVMSIYSTTNFSGEVTDYLANSRIIIPYLPPLMIIYFEWLSKKIQNNIHKFTLIIFTVILIISSIGIHFMHQDFLIENSNTWLDNHLEQLENSRQ